MIINYLHKIGWFFGLMLLQVLILNHIHLFGVATPLLYVYFILKFESGTSKNEVLLWAFFLGILIDIFADTPGMNAAAIVLMAILRPTFLRLFTPRDMLDSIVPSFKTLGVSSFLKYVVTMVLIHHLALIFIGFFSFGNLLMLLLQVVASSLLTILCILAIEGLRK